MVALLAALAVASTPHPSAAQELAPLEAVVVSLEACCSMEAWPEAEQLLVAEIEALEATVTTVDGGAFGGATGSLSEAAASSNAVCAARIGHNPDGDAYADVWVRNKAGDTTVQRHIGLGRRADSEAAAVAALRVAEALRAGLQELDLIARPSLEPEPSPEPAPSPPSKPKPSPPPEHSPEPARDQILGLGVGAVGLWSPGGVGILAALQVSGGWHPTKWLFAQADAALTIVGSEIEEDGARASLDLGVFRGWLMWEIRSRGVVRPAIGLGGGALVLWSTGSGSDDRFDMRTDRVWVGCAAAAAHLSLVLSRRMRLRFGARSSLLFPEVEVSFDGERVARFGRPLVEGFLDFEVYLL